MSGPPVPLHVFPRSTVPAAVYPAFPLVDTTNDESLELQPLNPDGGPAPGERHGSGKGVLRRMSRVRSDEADDIGRPAADHHPQYSPTVGQHTRRGEERGLRPPAGALSEACSQGASLLPGAQPMSPSEKLGAGLPLLQRLRMLKEKQEREERKLLPASPPSSLSPPTTADDSRLHSGPSSEEDSAAPRRVAAGSSILTRLASLKHAGRQPSAASSTASSDRHSDAEAVPCGPCSPTEALSPPPSATSSAPSRGGSLLLRDKLKTLVHAPAHTPPHTPPPPPQAQPPPPTVVHAATVAAAPPGELPRPGLVKKQPSWTILKRAAIVSSSGSREDESSDASAVSAPAALDRTAAEGGDAAAESDLVPGATPTDTPSSPARHKDVDDDQLPVPAVPGIAKENDAWRPSVEMASPPPASVGRPPPPGAEADPQPPLTCVAAAAASNTTPAVPLKRPAKPTLLQIQQRETKFYTSIDDLSPEYSGLPFVKKLKILNERQKLAELERTVAAAGFLRSSSLDSGGAPPGCLDGGLTR
ncbi:nascent polypeptide-associated complex subunit alpha, muscle-specific form-like [Schistocerca cancellata]|uniref:nascent polypeptide-associated complex subunit alpha, muscle-specific form-like n=1 Tax=Schistocerca cancellata TaxID=274614 RepID=UPI0021190C89|nr:nascent polypeptide-associated complex subunit alpha, muscle-specific form-like [Schistocerca cancellata]